MLEQFIASRREAILERSRIRVAARGSPMPSEAEIVHGVPAFLDQLGLALRRAESTSVVDHTAIRVSSALHGHALHTMGLSIEQVVHDYGDVCQVITELAVDEHTPISSAEFRTLNLCLDDAIAGAVSEYSRVREGQIELAGTQRLGMLVHELRNLLSSASLAFEVIKTGQVALGGSTSALLGRCLVGLRGLVDNSLADVRLDAGIEHPQDIGVAELLDDAGTDARMHADRRGIELAIDTVDSALVISGDRQVLAAALANMLQNAIKFTPKLGVVALHTRVTTEHVAFDIADACGGLPPGRVEELFDPFAQRGGDRSGAGLGLAICRKAAHAHRGHIHVRDVPGTGCIFTLELPRSATI